MSQRKLTRRQAWRAEKIQQERLARSQKKSDAIQAELEGSTLGPEQPGRVLARYGTRVDVEDGSGEVHQCLMRQNLPAVVCGDNVVWQAGRHNSGVIVAVEPRQTLLERPDADNQLKAVAANIQQIVIIAAPQPGLDFDLINRYLVAAELTRIAPLIVINKIDTLSPESLAKLTPRLRVYQDIGYTVVLASTRQPHGLDALQQQLRDQTSIFVGQSGVGKSSLIQALLPKASLRIGELSAATGLGQHTTTTTQLYHFTGGGELIDSPGVRAFRLGHASVEGISRGFVEFRPLLGHCRFSNCQHRAEPDCALKTAVANGSVNAERFESFLRILASSGDEPGTRPY